jgi:DNA-binding CsgD family transcriptional regulator
VARRIIRAFQQPVAAAPPRPFPTDLQTSAMTLSGLAPKERTVLEHLATGAMYKEVAAEMGISMNTVLTYIRRIYGKLQVNSRHHAVEWYRRHR